MKYTDRVYGNFEITEPVILELINSPTLQRLKEIDQAGYFEPHFPGTAHSRFEHSIGDYLLLKNYGAPIERGKRCQVPFSGLFIQTVPDTFLYF